MSVKYLMAFGTDDNPVNFNDRFRSIFSVGIFSGGSIVDATSGSTLQVGVLPFVATTCDGGVVRDDFDTQVLTVPANKPDGVYICLLAKYRNFDLPQLEWKVVEPSCLTTCADADCYIVFGLVKTGASTITDIIKYGPHRLDKCNKHSLHVFDTVANLPVISDGLVRGELAFVIETRQFYWWDDTLWRPLASGGGLRIIVVVNQNASTGVVDIDASLGDIFRIVINYSGPITFNAPTNPVDGKFIEIQFATPTAYEIFWNFDFYGTTVPLPSYSSGAFFRRDRVIFECYQTTWSCTFVDTRTIKMGDSAVVQNADAAIAIGIGTIIGNFANNAVAIGYGATASAPNAVSIGGYDGSSSASITELSNNSVALGAGSIINAASDSVSILGNIGIFAANSIAIRGTIGEVANSSIAIGNAQVDNSAYSSLVLGCGTSISEAAEHDNILIGSGVSTGIGSTYAIAIGFGVYTTSGSVGSIIIGGTSIGGTLPSFIDNGSLDSIVIGNSCGIDNGSYNSIALGTNSVVVNGSNQSIAIGYGVQAGTPGISGGSSNSILIGTGVKIDNGASRSAVIGSYVIGMSIVYSRIDNGSEDAAIIGNSSLIDHGSDGSRIFGNSSTIDTSANSLAIGNSISISTSANTIAIGSSVSIGSASCIAIATGSAPGSSYILSGATNSIIIGVDTKLEVDCDHTILIGDAAHIYSGCTPGVAKYSIGIGPNSSLGYGIGMIALGATAYASGNNSISIGVNSNSDNGGCVIGARTQGVPANLGSVLRDFTVNTVKTAMEPGDQPSFISLRAYNLPDASSGGMSDTDVNGTSASRTSILVHSNLDADENPRRICSYPASSLANLITEFPGARILFIDNPT